MDNPPFLSYKIEDRSYLSFIKREIHNLLLSHGFSSGRTGEADIIVSELTSNLTKHATSGELLYRVSIEEENKLFEIYCIDEGPGIVDVKLMMRDGASSTNTLGQGLGSINRLSSLFQIYSMKDWGTVAYSKLLMKPHSFIPVGKKGEFNFRALQVNMPGEKVCGDGYFVKKDGNQTIAFVGDGLGHGQQAFEAVQTGIEAFKNTTETEPSHILKYIHTQVKKTRGLVATIAALNHQTGQWKICGIGNIMTRLFSGLVSRNYMAHNGIIGLNIPNTINDYTIADEKFQYIIICSDGIKTRWDLNKYPGFFKYDPALLAGILFKDYARRNDDMSVFIGKVKP